MLGSEDLKTIYNNWIVKKFAYKDINSGVIRIDTPFFDRHNDSLILYALIDSNNNIVLTDGGYVLDDLESSGVDIIASPKKTELLKKHLNSYGVNLKDSDLSIKTNVKDFPHHKHRLLQAMLFTNDMFMLGKKTVKGIFFEDVAKFLEKNNIRAFQNANFVGNSGMTHKFEFSIPGIKNIPDKLIKTLNVPNNEMYAKALTADVKNTAEVFNRPSKFYAFINDQEKEITPDILHLLEYDNIKVIPFSKKKEIIAELAQ